MCVAGGGKYKRNISLLPRSLSGGCSFSSHQTWEKNTNKQMHRCIVRSVWDMVLGSDLGLTTEMHTVKLLAKIIFGVS